jgi:ribosomal protein S18 acetylase RimI-like enzyme
MWQQKINLFYHAEKAFFGQLSLDHIQLDPHISVFITGIQAANLNLVSQKAPCTSLQQTLIKATALYHAYQVPWIWVLRKDLCTPAVETLFENHGLEFLEESTAMTYDLTTSLPSPSFSLKIVEEGGFLEDWGYVVGQAFESSPGVMTEYCQAHRRMNHPGTSLHHLVGYLGSQPVTALTLSIMHAICRIDDVATLPEHQGKGYATQLLHYALRYAQTLNATHCFLESSQAGLSLYQKVGFGVLFINAAFTIEKS